RTMLDEMPEIDAVIVSTPDHHHAFAAVRAMQLGKHVYCQKPLAHSVWEARRMRETAAQQQVVTQMGNQGHAYDSTRRIVELVRAGVLGEVRQVHVWTDRPIWPQGINRPTATPPVPEHLDWERWLGPAPTRPYHPDYLPFKWRGWWDFGTGALGDMACHNMDAAFWALNLGYPTRIEAESTKLYPETAPACSRITYSFAAKGSRPPVTVVWRDGSLYPPRPKEITDPLAWPFDTSGQLWIGDAGKLIA